PEHSRTDGNRPKFASPAPPSDLYRHPRMQQPQWRRSLRVPGFDYSLSGAYFVTICLQRREDLFGRVVGAEVRHSAAGAMVKRQWERLGGRFPGPEIDEFVVMPDHLHGILMLRQDRRQSEPI